MPFTFPSTVAGSRLLPRASNRTRSLVLVCAASLATLVLGGCSGGDGAGDMPATSLVGVRFSDAPVDQASVVVISVDSLTFVPEEGEPIVVDRFSSSETGAIDAETFQIDLLDYTGSDSLLVLDPVALPVGTYRNLLVDVIDENTEASWVEDAAEPGVRKTLKVPSDVLKLGGFEVTPDTAQQFVVEFNLHSSMTYNPGPDRYILKPHGVRIVGLAEAASLSVSVDPALCPAATETGLTSSVYLYAGDIGESVAGDVLDTSADTGAAGAAETTDPEMRPVDVVAVTFPAATDDGQAPGTALLSYLPPGLYTLALGCSADTDDPAVDDDLVIPFPADARGVATLAAGGDAHCQFTAPDPAQADGALSVLDCD